MIGRAMVVAIVVGITAFFVVPANAQSATGPTWLNATSDHHQMMYRMMKDMTDQMTQMTDQMSRGDLTPEQGKQIAQRMRLMSTIMQRMSGLAARPAMGPIEWQKQMDEMRKKMTDMARNTQTTPGTK